MATDVEESDTDDHEKPAPPKRLCTRLVINDTYPKTDERMMEKEEPISEPEIIEFDEAEKYAREKLKRWQDCQFAKGFVDNTINRVLENYIMAPSSYSIEDSRFCAFRGDEMEDTAVMMAIRNHGLVQSAEFVSHSHAFPNNEISSYWNAEELDSTVSCYSPGNQGNSLSNLGATTSTTSPRSIDMRGIGRYNDINWDSDKHNDTDNQEDFMERAVAEAIKKKGLSALSVDYG